MIPCLIDPRAPAADRRGFSLLEMMIAVAFTVLLLTGVCGFYNASAQTYSAGIAGQSLQAGATTVLNKITEGETESGVIYRLSSAVSYLVPNGVGAALYTCGGSSQTTPCNAAYPFSELYYCQDSPCVPTDATARWYYLNSTGTSVLYHHPKAGGGTQEETVYTAPEGSTLALRFVAATSNPNNVVEIDSAALETVSAKVTNARLAATGAASTYVLLRNHP